MGFPAAGSLATDQTSMRTDNVQFSHEFTPISTNVNGIEIGI
jgi:hypothetical protein